MSTAIRHGMKKGLLSGARWLFFQIGSLEDASTRLSRYSRFWNSDIW
jgi:hypothetical protein